MIVNGREIAEKIKADLKEEVSKSAGRIRLAIVKVGGDLATEKFLEQKKKFAEAIGVDVRTYEIPADISTNKLREKVSDIVRIKENSGVIIQLPLPEQINAQYILDAIIPEKDPDMLSAKSIGAFAAGKAKIFPPVVAAIREIFTTCGVELKAKNAVVVGAGRLVGKPIATWLINEGATVSIVDESTKNISGFTREADVIISGAGKPKIITPEMLKDGVIAIDAGTSESEGKLSGDIDPEVEKKSALFSPVPGGVGPLTVAMLFKNLIELQK